MLMRAAHCVIFKKSKNANYRNKQPDISQEQILHEMQHLPVKAMKISDPPLLTAPNLKKKKKKPFTLH